MVVKAEPIVEVVSDNSKMAFVKVENASKELIKDMAERIYDWALFFLETFNKYDTGHLSKSGDVIIGDDFAAVYWDCPYARAVHDGRDPGSMPPLEPLIAWVKRKGFDNPAIKISWSLYNWFIGVGLATPPRRGYPKPDDKVRFTKEFRQVAIAFYIAKKIEKYGIEAAPFLSAALNEVESEIPEIVKTNALLGRGSEILREFGGNKK